MERIPAGVRSFLEPSNQPRRRQGPVISFPLEAGRAVPVTVRDARSTPLDREWIRTVYRDYLTELSIAKTGLFPALGEWESRESEFLAGWFADSSAHPFVILVDNRHAGFALVSRPPPFPKIPVDYRMAEFFITENSRRRGVGASAAALLFNRFAGNWEVLEDGNNRSALNFWRRVIGQQTSGRFSETNAAGEVRHRFRTETHPSMRGAR